MSERIRRLLGITPRDTIVYGKSPSAPEFARARKDIDDLIKQGNLAGAVARMREVPSSGWIGGASDTFINQAAEKLVEQYVATGKVPQELIDFYAARGVPTETLAALAAGELPMDAASRLARAEQMGLVMDTPTVRFDSPGKTEFRGRNRGGLVYTGLQHDRALRAAQAKGQSYPLIGQKVLGLHENNADDLDITRGKYLDDAQHHADTFGDDKSPSAARMGQWREKGNALRSVLEEQAVLPYAQGTDARTMALLPESNGTVPGAEELSKRVAPHFAEYEVQPGWEVLDPTEWSGGDLANYQVRELLNDQGVGGILVGDEGPLSVAYHNAPTMRHATLSLLDPAAKNYSNIYRAALPLVAAAGAAGTANAAGTPQSALDPLDFGDLPALTREELSILRSEFPNMTPEAAELFANMEAAADKEQMLSQRESGKVDSGDMTLDDIPRGSPNRMQAVRDAVGPEGMKQQDQFMREAGQARMPDWNTTDQFARQRLENYHSAVSDAMQQPVISVRAAVDKAVEQMGLEGEQAEAAAQAMQQRMAEAHPTGFMSPASYLREVNIQPFVSQIETLRSQGREIPDEMVEGMVQALEERSAVQAQAVADHLGQKTYSPEAESAAALVRQAVVDHAPKGKYAAYGQRTASEQAALKRDPTAEDPRYTLTPEGTQNHQALRVSELFSAGDEEYLPSTNVSQAMRMVTPFIHGGRAADTAVSEFVQMGSPEGKYGYAADLYRRAGEGDQSQVFGKQGEPKNVAYDMKNPLGLAQRMYNTSFPMAKLYNETAPVREVGLHIGEVLAGRDPVESAANIRRLRRENRQITPVVPGGVDPAKHRELGEKLDSADTRMEGAMSAWLGPKFADAGNVSVSALNSILPKDQQIAPFERTYLSPAASTLLSVPGESFSDPINLVWNIGGAGIGGAIRGGFKQGVMGAARGGVSGVMSAPFRMLDDVGEEMVENNLIAPATMGFTGFISPEKDNLMMQGWKYNGRQGTPNDPGHDEEVGRRHVQARQDQMEAGDEYAKLRANPKSTRRTKATVGWEANGQTSW